MKATIEAAPPFVLVTGGKGGVGKTTVAANLGVELARIAARPLLCDLDFGLANLDVVLGLAVERNVESFLDDEVDLEQCFVEGPHGLRVLAAGSGSYERSRPDPNRRRRLLDAFSRCDAGLVLGDSSAGIGADVLDFALGADRVLVVTTPDPAAVTDAYGVIKALDSLARDKEVEVPTPEVFVNFARDAREARTIAEKLRGVCERFLARSPRFVGWMPRSRGVLKGVLEQRAFVLSDPRSIATRALAGLARRYAPTGPFPPARQAGRGVETASKGTLGHGR